MRDADPAPPGTVGRPPAGSRDARELIASGVQGFQNLARTDAAQRTRKESIVKRILLLPALAAAVALTAHAEEPSYVVEPGAPGLQWGPCPEFMPAGCEIAVLHGDPAQPNVDVFFRVPGDSVVPKHRHSSAERMVLVSGELRVTYEGQEEAVIRTGSYAFGPAGRPHSAYCAPGDPCVLFIAFVDPLDAILVE